MIYTESEILQYIDDNDVKFVKLTFCDLNGKMKNISVLSSEMAAVFAHGIRISSKKIAGFSVAGRRDIYLFPDASAMTILPWRPQHGRVIRMFCYIRYADGTPFEGDSRYFLKKAMKAAVKKGYCFRFGTSCEFTLFRQDINGLPTKTPHDYAGYCDIAPDDKGENFRRDVCLTLEQMGIHPVSSRHKSGCGQHEIDFNASSALKAADTFLSFKSAVKSVAENHGVHASFMPKPLRDDCGNGMHISMSLFRDSEFFGDGVSAADSSSDEEAAAAGIMEHIREFTMFTNSIVNSYSRLGEFTAPRYVAWSSAEEGQLLRLCLDPSGNADSPMILRAPDCVCDPYLVFGLMIYAALDGIEKGLKLPEEYSPENTGYKLLPSNLREAAQLAADSDFLREHMPDNVLEKMTGTRLGEWEEYVSARDKETFEERKFFYSL